MKHVRIYSQKGCRNIHLASLKARLEQKQVCIRTLLTSWERKRVQWNKSIKYLFRCQPQPSLQFSCILTLLRASLKLSVLTTPPPPVSPCMLLVHAGKRTQTTLEAFFFYPNITVITLSVRKNVYCLEKFYRDNF